MEMWTSMTTATASNPPPLTPEEFAVLRDAADVLFPAEPDGVGAVEAGALDYVQRLLSKDGEHLPSVFRAGITWLESTSRARYGQAFAGLPRQAAEDIIAGLMGRAEDIETMSGGPSSSYDAPRFVPYVTPETAASQPGNALTGPGALSAEVLFIALFWQHLREGLFADPRHGGNRDAMVWRWLGYNGPQLHGYTDSEILEDVIPVRPLRTAADWAGIHE
jgi:hypothetical protein